MSYKDKYTTRSNAYGASLKDAYNKSMINGINKHFKDDLSYKSILIENVATDVRIVTTDRYSEKTLLFPPSTTVSIGSYCMIDSQTWVISELFANATYPSATILLCNETLKWKDKNGVTKSYACAVNRGNRGALNSTNGGQFNVQLPNGYLYIDVQINADTRILQVSQRLILNGRVYKIDGIDNITQTINGAGLLKLTIKPDTVISQYDDFVNSVADNSVLYGGSAAGTPPASGGALW